MDEFLTDKSANGWTDVHRNARRNIRKQVVNRHRGTTKTKEKKFCPPNSNRLPPSRTNGLNGLFLDFFPKDWVVPFRLLRSLDVLSGSLFSTISTLASYFL